MVKGWLKHQQLGIWCWCILTDPWCSVPGDSWNFLGTLQSFLMFLSPRAVFSSGSCSRDNWALSPGFSWAEELWRNAGCWLWVTSAAQRHKIHWDIYIKVVFMRFFSLKSSLQHYHWSLPHIFRISLLQNAFSLAFYGHHHLYPHNGFYQKDQKNSS